MRIIYSENVVNQSHFLLQIKRAYPFLFRNISFRKLWNGLICLLEMATKQCYLHSHPVYLRVEVCPYCNLHCVGCLLGGNHMPESNPNHRRNGSMAFELFRDSIQDLLPYLFRVWLYDEGEPFLNRDIFKIISYLHDNNVGTCVSSNFSIQFTDDDIQKMVDCGLQHLIISVDGATQESYSRYRAGGDLSLVLSNIRRLQTAISEKRNSNLKVEIQFLEFEHNKSDRAGVCRIAEDLGVWRLGIGINSRMDGSIGLRKDFKEEEKFQRGCYEIWMGTTINSIGELGTCDPGEDFGMPNIGLAKNYKSANLRNHPSLVQLRQSFKDESVPMNDICRNCYYTLKRIKKS